MVTPPGLENNQSDASLSEDAPAAVEKSASMAQPHDVSHNVTVPSLGTVTAEAFEALEEAIRAGDTTGALELAARLRAEVPRARRRPGSVDGVSMWEDAETIVGHGGGTLTSRLGATSTSSIRTGVRAAQCDGSSSIPAASPHGPPGATAWGTLLGMKVFSAKIRDGTIVTDAAVDLPEGATVTVVADDEDGFDVTPEQERELISAMEEADRGDLVPAAELLARLRS
jgi:hypothetical protein